MNKFEFFDFRRNKIETNQKRNEKEIEILAQEIVRKFKKKKLFLAIMESCTGGGLANVITNVVGASDVFKGGFVTYSNQEKIARGVPKKMIQKYSVYSPQVALAMAQRAIKEVKGTDFGVGITGSFSRPDPKNPNSQVGQVFVGIVFKNKKLVINFLFPNLKKRSAMKAMVLRKILEIMRKII